MSWGMKSKPPAAVPGGIGNMSVLPESARVFIRQVGGRKMRIVLKEFKLTVQMKGVREGIRADSGVGRVCKEDEFAPLDRQSVR